MADPSEVKRTASTKSREVIPVVWGSVPRRNKNFTGREDLLTQIRQQLTGNVAALVPHTLHGMGGVGKTQLAIEYAYRYRSEYQVVWWVPADQVALARSSLAALAPRLGVADHVSTRIEDAVRATLEALRCGDPYDRWLIIFDNADQPEDLRRPTSDSPGLDLIPEGPGHVIVTSRNPRWGNVAEAVEVDVFSRAESLEFLHRRVSGMGDAEASRLAEELGDLPIALEQAGALQVESGMSADEYLELLAEESGKVLAENRPTDYPVSIAAAWSLSMTRLKEQMPFAWDLLRRCAFFGSEPIQRDLLKNGRYVLAPPLRDQLGDTILVSRATRELGRYALARVDVHNKTLQIHRLIQRLIRDEMTPADAAKVRHDVHLLLSAADPDDPDDIDNWGAYGQLLPHIVPSEAVTSADPGVRLLVRNVVRYLLNVGDLQTGADLSHAALQRWTADSGPEDADTLVLAGQRADLLWAAGSYPEAYELRHATLGRMRQVLGEDHEETLVVTNGYGADLRTRGDFAEALELDRDTLERHREVLGDDHPRTFNVLHNLAVDQGLNSDYLGAHETDKQLYEARLELYGRDDHPSILHTLSSIGRDLWQSGQCHEGLAVEERAHAGFEEVVRQRTLPAGHPWVLQQAKELSVARRKMGDMDAALNLAEDVYQRYLTSLGHDHPETLAAAMNLGTANRASGGVTHDPDRIEQADRQIEVAFHNHQKVYGPNHPYTHGCALNLATARRLLGRFDDARQLLEEALSGLQSRLGESHHYTLTCMASLAMALADTHDVEGARDLGQQALEGLRSVVGPDHPHTLACTSNLALDLRALGEEDRADKLVADAVDRYRQVLPADHPDVIDAAGGRRVAFDFEPPPP